MKNKGNISSNRKILQWVLVVVVLVLILAGVWWFIAKRKVNNEVHSTSKPTETLQEEQYVEEKTPEDIEDELDSGEAIEPISIEYDDVLSSDSYTIKDGSISFAENMNIRRFALSNSENGPTEEDTWIELEGEYEIQLDEEMASKKYVYYQTGSQVNENQQLGSPLRAPAAEPTAKLRAETMEVEDQENELNEEEGESGESIATGEASNYILGITTTSVRRGMISKIMIQANQIAPTETGVEGPYDVSATGFEGSVLVWFVPDGDKYKMVIGGDGIIEPQSCANLFRSYINCAAIEGLENLDTSKATTMYYMFYGCSSLGILDVSGFDTSKVTTMHYMFYGCSSLGILDVSGFDTSKVTMMHYMFYGCSSLGILDVSRFDTSKVTTMYYMFCNCSSLETLDVSHFDTSKVTSMYCMFYRCSGLTTLDVSGFDTSKVTSMYCMFYRCSGLTTLDVSHFDTSKVTSMYCMFRNCSSLETLDVSRFDTSKVTSMYCMFYGCSGLTTLDVSRFDTSKVTSMYGMFYGCSGLTTLDVSHFDTSKVTTMRSMFNGCSGLETLDVSGFDTSKVTTMYYMFNGCSGLTTLDVSEFDTSNVTDMGYMFRKCSNLESLDLSNFNTSKVTSMTYMFSGCGAKKIDVSSFDTSSVTGSMSYMFNSCSNIEILDLSSFDLSKTSGVESFIRRCPKLKAIMLGVNCNRLNGTDMFSGCSNLKAVISKRNDTEQLMQYSANNGLKGLSKAPSLYFLNQETVDAYKASEDYINNLGADRIKLILELDGDKTINVNVGEEYKEKGALVAGFNKDEEAIYKQLGYILSMPVIIKDETEVNSVDTLVPGKYKITYSLTYKKGKAAPEDVMDVTRTVNVVKEKPVIKNVIINGGAPVSLNKITIVDLDIEDASFLTDMYISEQYTAPTESDWVRYQKYSRFDLSNGNGTKTLYVWVRDSYGNVSSVKSGSIGLTESYTLVIQCNQTYSSNHEITKYYALRRDGANYSSWVTTNSYTGLVPDVIYYAKTKIKEIDTTIERESNEIIFRIDSSTGKVVLINN